MAKILLVAVLLSIVCSGLAQFDSEYFMKYDQYPVYKVYVDSNAKETLDQLQNERKMAFDYWKDARKLNDWAHIMVRPEERKMFEELLSMNKVKYSLLIEDVGVLLKQQIEKNSEKNSNLKVGDFDYSKYHTLDQINDWMNMIEAAYPKYVTIFNVSRSYQKRDIFAMKISIPNGSKKPAIWFDGGIHSREWISSATVIYMAYSFLSNYSIDPNVTQLLNAFDLYVLPVFNVDGYEYTWTKDRMWRKTRSKTPIPTCYGADPNRNWDNHWCEQGSSKDPCSDTYCGEKAFSEIEVQGVANFILANKDTIVGYLNFHSYSQLWMSPYGWTTQLPPQFKIQDGGSIAALKALSDVYGTQYQHGNIASTIYVASGSSADWCLDAANIIYSYGVELRDQGQYGFLLPPDQIIPSGKETFEALKALAFYIKAQLKI